MGFKNHSSSMLRSFFLTLSFSLTVLIQAQLIVDKCTHVPGRGRVLGSLVTLSSNIIIEDQESKNFDDDSNRYRRRHNGVGYLSYISQHGFMGLEVTGFVKDSNSSNSWSLSVVLGSPLTKGNGTRGSVFTMTDKTIKKHRTDGKKGNWVKFKFELSLTKYCPRRINILLNGSANEDAFSKFGVQLSEIRLMNSWYEHCEASCQISEETCTEDKYSKQYIDDASNFYSMTSCSPNIELDYSNTSQLHQQDTVRFKRSNNKPGQIVYKATKGILLVEIDYYQKNPSTTHIALFPYTHQSCQPIRLEPVISEGSGPVVSNWTHKVAYFDLSSLPFCAKYASIHISGGKEGWELQISNVNLTVLGELSKRHRSSPRVFERPASTLSAGGGTGGSPTGWWIWLLAFFGAVIVFMSAASIVRIIRLCLGDDDRHIYHISNWLPRNKLKCKGDVEMATVTVDIKRAAEVKKTSFTNTSQKLKHES
eukprot:g6835.t1